MCNESLSTKEMPSISRYLLRQKKGETRLFLVKKGGSIWLDKTDRWLWMVNSICLKRLDWGWDLSQENLLTFGVQDNVFGSAVKSLTFCLQWENQTGDKNNGRVKLADMVRHEPQIEVMVLTKNKGHLTHCPWCWHLVVVGTNSYFGPEEVHWIDTRFCWLLWWPRWYRFFNKSLILASGALL